MKWPHPWRRSPTPPRDPANSLHDNSELLLAPYAHSLLMEFKLDDYSMLCMFRREKSKTRVRIMTKINILIGWWQQSPYIA